MNWDKYIKKMSEARQKFITENNLVPTTLRQWKEAGFKEGWSPCSLNIDPNGLRKFDHCNNDWWISNSEGYRASGCSCPDALVYVKKEEN